MSSDAKETQSGTKHAAHEPWEIDKMRPQRGGRPPLRVWIAIAQVAMLVGLAPLARAEVSEVRVAQQFGISYLPLTVMHHEQLLEKAAAKADLPALKVDWAQFGAGNAMNEALLSGNLDFPSGGVGPLLTIWSKTRGRQDVKAVAALNSMPLYLVSVNPAVKTIKDLTDKDRIALPAVKVSIQAVTLEMAAAQAFGDGQYNKLDPLTVSLAHPDAMAAMLTGKTEITAHFGSAPFMYQELDDPRAHRVLDSYDVLGGPHTFNVVWTLKKFHDENPRVYAAFLAALNESVALIHGDPKRAAQIYIDEEKSKLAPDFVEKMLRDPENVFTTVPNHVMKYAEFMAKVHAIDAAPADWKELFFPELHGASGS
jgi:NitT/TauT family transport system substrate-binding protein